MELIQVLKEGLPVRRRQQKSQFQKLECCVKCWSHSIQITYPMFKLDFKKNISSLWILWQHHFYFMFFKLGQVDVYHCVAVAVSGNWDQLLDFWKSSSFLIYDSFCSTVMDLFFFLSYFSFYDALNVFSWWKVWIVGRPVQQLNIHLQRHAIRIDVPGC